MRFAFNRLVCGSFVLFGCATAMPRLQPPPARATAADARGCAGMRPEECHAAAVALENSGVARDARQAAGMYVEACAANFKPACVEAARGLHDGTGGSRDERLARERMLALCREGVPMACSRSAQLRMSAQGGPVDPDAIRTEAAAGCGNDEALGCEMLALALHGRRGSELESRAAAEKACRLDPEAHCFARGLQMAESGDAAQFQPGLEILVAACERNQLSACSKLGNIYGLGRQVAQDWKKAEAAWRKACVGGLPYACAQLVILYSPGGAYEMNPAGIINLLEHACGQGSRPGCGMLGVALYVGMGKSYDYDRAAELTKTACDAGFAPSCAFYGMMLVEGKGVPADPVRGYEILRAECARKAGAACSYLNKHGDGGAPGFLQPPASSMESPSRIAP